MPEKRSRTMKVGQPFAGGNSHTFVREVSPSGEMVLITGGATGDQHHFAARRDLTHERVGISSSEWLADLHCAAPLLRHRPKASKTKHDKIITPPRCTHQGLPIDDR